MTEPKNTPMMYLDSTESQELFDYLLDTGISEAEIQELDFELADLD